MDSLVARLKLLDQEDAKGITFIRNAGKEDFLSYKRLYNDARGILAGLLEKGLAPGDEAILLIEDTENFLVFFWACLLGRIIPIPLSTGKQIAYINKAQKVWKELGYPVVISDDPDEMSFVQLFQEQEDSSQKHLKLFFCKDIHFKDPAIPVFESKAGDIAFIQYSSGSTSDPKGVTLTHENILFNAADIIESSNTQASDSSICWMPLTHDMGLIGFHLTSLIAAIPQYIIPTSLFIRRPLLWLESAGRHGITQLYSSNFGLQYAVTFFKPTSLTIDLSHVRIIYNGAEPVSWQTCDRFLNTFKQFGLNADVMLPVYGMAEASVAVTIPAPGKEAIKFFRLDRKFLQVGDSIRVKDEEEEGVVFLSVGQPLRNCSIRVCDINDNSLTDDVIGRIQILGKNVTKGYYRQKDNERLFTKDGWLRTGDLGFMHQGMLIVTGREKHVYILNGQNYYYHDIEQIVEQIKEVGPGKVACCCISGNKDEAEQLAVFIVFRDNAAAFSGVAMAVREKLAVFLGISTVKVLPVRKIPRTSSGKVQYFQLINDWNSGAFVQHEYELGLKSYGDKEQEDDRILGTLSVALGRDIKQRDNIQEYGLNSIQAMKLAVALNSEFDISVEVSDIFTHLIAEDLVNHVKMLIAGRLGIEAPAAVQNRDWHPVSSGQGRFFMLNDDPAFTDALILRYAFLLEGNLNISALTYAFSRLTDIHEVFRTRFLIRGADIYQVIKEFQDKAVSLNIHDCPAGLDVEEALFHLLKQTDRRRFELDNGPLLYVDLLKIDDEKYILLLNGHHIILDHWSLSFITSELSRQYNDFLSGRISHDVPNRPQFKDFVSESLNLLHTGGLQSSVSYWSQELSGAPSLVSFPFGRRKHMQEQGGSSSKRITFNKALLSAFSRERGASVFMTMLSVINTLIFKYTGAKDIVIGTNVAGRWHKEWMNEIGLFTNTLPLRCRFNEDDSFDSLLATVKEKVLLAIKHQKLPFEKILELLPDRKEELFNVLVLYQHEDFLTELAFSSVNSSSIHHTALSSSGFSDLQFELTETLSGIDVILKYRKSVFDESSIINLLKHFENLLTSITQDSALPINAYTYIDDAERALIQHTFNNTFREYAQNSVIGLFERTTQSYPLSVALSCNGVSLSYLELNEAADRLSCYLADTISIEGGDFIGIMMERSERFLIAVLAVLKTGAAYIPVNTEWPEQRTEFIINDSGITLLITERAYHPAYDDQINVLLYEDVMEMASALPERHLSTRYSADLPAYVIYTSGSTGLPKGVVVSQGSFYDYVQTFISYFGINASDRVVQQGAISFDLSIEEIFPVLCVGGRLVISGEGGSDIDKLIKTIQQEEVTVLSTTPLSIEQINRMGVELGSLRILISGGDELRAAHISNLVGKLKLFNTYGPTESTICATYHNITSLTDAGTIGKPISNRTVYILDEQLDPVPIGIKGEIFIGGAGLATGYLNQPGLTAEKFIESPFASGSRLYSTGDLGYWLEDGSIEFSGRKDKQLKIHGYRTEPAEVAHFLARFPDIINAYVLSLENKLQQKYLVAFYTSNSSVEETELRQYLLKYLPRQIVPARFLAVDMFPVTTNGKVDEKTLESIFYNKRQLYSAASTIVQDGLVRIWEQVLELSPIGIDDNFFELGGQSIAGIQIIGRVNLEFKVHLNIGHLFTYNTISLLSGLVAVAQKTQFPDIVPIPQLESYELSMAQKGLWMLHKLEGSSVVFNIFGVYELMGALDIDILKDSFDVVIRRHESLRTSFIEIDGAPRQVINKQATFPMQCYNLKFDVDKESIIDRIIQEERQQEFELDSWPLARAVLLLCDDNRALLIFSMHHLIADGVSASIFAEEFFAAYNMQCCKLTDPILSDLSIQYKEFVYWQQNLLKGEFFDQARLFWKEHMKDAIPGINLPYDFKVSEKRGYAGAIIQFPATAGISDSLDAICKTDDLTAFMTLLAIVNIYLHKIADQDDIVLVSPFSGRVHPDFEKPVGLFVNALVFRNMIEPEDTIKAFFQQVKYSTLKVLEYKELPFELLLPEITENNHGNNNKVFNVRLLLDEGEIQMNDFNKITSVTQDLAFRQYKHDAFMSIHDITIIFSRSQDLYLTIEYNTSLFKPETITLFAIRLLKMMEQILTNPEMTITAIDMRLDFEKEDDKRVGSFFTKKELF